MLFRVICVLSFVLCAVDACIDRNIMWKCALERANFGRTCLNSADIHRQVMGQDVLSQPLLLAIEGARYEKLFKDCDSDKNGCISMHEALLSETCKRDCRWRNYFHEIMC